MWLGFQAFGAHFLGRGSGLDEFLDKDDITLEELLEKDETIIEARSLNPKLLRFITTERQSQLIEYITVEPSLEDSPKRIYNYPFAASEFFSPDCHDILVRFFEEEHLLDSLFKFLQTEEALNLTLAGYFSKAVSSLLRKNPSGMLVIMCQDNHYALDLTKHIYSSSITDLLDRIILTPTNSFTSTKLQILETLLHKIEPVGSLEEILNASNVLQSFILKHINVSDGDSLMLHLWTEQNLRYIVEKLFCNVPWTVRASAAVIKCLMYCTVQDLSSDEETPKNEKSMSIIDVYLSFMPDILRYLQTVSSSTVATTYGVNITPIGEDKIALIEILYVGLKKGYCKLIEYVIQEKVLKVVTDMFVNNAWNSVLHNLYVGIVNIVVSSDNLQLIHSIMEDAQLPVHLVNIVTQGTSKLDSGKEIRLGHIGQVTRISNLLIEKSASCPYISEVLKNTSGWENYKINVLAQINELENKLLGGKSLNQVSSSQSEDDYFEQRDSIGSDFITYSRVEDKEDVKEAEDKPMSFEDLICRSQDEELMPYNSNVFWKLDSSEQLEELDE